MMVAAGNGGQEWDNPESISSVEIYDFTLDSWFYSGDLPEVPYYENHGLMSWSGNPVWLNHKSIWKFEEGTWSQLESGVTGHYSSDDLLLMVPDDFILDC